VGGGTYVRDYIQPTAPLETIRTKLSTTTPTHETENDAALRSNVGRESAAGATGTAGTLAGMETPRAKTFENPEPATQDSQTSANSAPYWGSLPTGADGAVYNTVTGHGSATDDHGEHHHLPPKSASASSARAVIAGKVANSPRGGVYNTVTGHGSQDEEVRRHGQPRDLDDNTNMAAVGGGYAAPLADVPEHGRQGTSHQAAFADSQNTAPGFLPETAVRDDVLLAEAAKGNAGLAHSQETQEAAPHRAFPLSGAPFEGVNDPRESASPSRHGAAAGIAGLGAGAAAAAYVGKRRTGNTPADQNRTQSESLHPDNRHQTVGGVHQEDRHRTVAGVHPDNRHQTVGGVHPEDRHQTVGIHQEDRHQTVGGVYPEDRHQTVGTVQPDNRHQTVGGAVTGKRQPSQPRSPVEKSSSHEEESPKGEKKHRILGIFHRHRDDGKEDNRRKSVGEHAEPAKQDIAAVNSPNRLRKLTKGESATERRRSRSSARTDEEEHPNHNKEKAAAGAAAGAGVLGLLHHRKRNSISERPQDTTNPISEPMSANVGGAGPAGSAGDALHQIEEVSTPYEHPREPPMPPAGNEGLIAAGAAGPSGHYGVLGSGTPSGVTQGSHLGAQGTTTNEPSNSHETTRRDVVSGHPGNHNALASSGIPASEAPREHMLAREPGNYNVLQSSGTSTADRTQMDGSGAVTQGTGNYNTLASGIPSGIKQQSSTSGAGVGDGSAATQTQRGGIGNVTQEPGNYNTLASGIPSGIKQESSSAGTGTGNLHAATDNARGTELKPEYNVLPSGTLSGVKVKPKPPHDSSHTSDPVLHADNQAAHGQYNTLASGTASGVNPDTLRHQPQGPSDMTSRAQALNDQPDPNATATQQHEFIPMPIPSHVKRDRSQQQHPSNASQESLPGITTYPHPEMVHNMSPEVMPAAYTASAPGRSQGQQQQQQQAQAHTQPQYQSQYPPQQQQQQQETPAKDRILNPALAAATTPWASSAAAGKSAAGVGQGQGQGGVAGRGRTVHTCQHCGGENDITGYLDRFAREMALGAGGKGV